MTFGQRLRDLREEKSIKQRDLADIIKISPRMISFYENDVHFPRDSGIITALAKFFNVSLDYLFGVTNIRNSIIFSDFYNEFNKLPPAGQAELLDYIRYLKLKYRERK